MGTKQKSPERWGFFGKQVNRDVIGWFAGGVAAVVMAAWAVFTYDGADSSKKEPGASNTVNVDNGLGAIGDIQTRDVIIGPKPGEPTIPGGGKPE